MRFLKILLTSAGIAGLLGATVLSPDFVLKHLSSDGIVTAEGYEAIKQLRLFAFLLGSLLTAAGSLFFIFPERARNLLKRPAGAVLMLIIGWLVMAFVNYLMKKMGMSIGTPDLFPFSELDGPRIHIAGLPFSVMFLAVLFLSIKYSGDFNVFQIWIIGLSLILLGNLAQGGVEEAFYKPISAPFYYLNMPHYQQYYHDAVKITDWHEWLRSFNLQQAHLLSHTRTHPPFAVLLHYFFIRLFHGNLMFIAGSFIFLSSISMILIYQIMKGLDLPKQQSAQFALLFSVVPAYNIYSAVSLDGVVISFCTLFLSGVIMMVKNRRGLSGVLFFISGLLLMNILTFTGFFMVAASGIIALRELFINRKLNVLLALAILLLIMLMTHVCMKTYFGYDHIQAFLTAVHLEPESLFNPIAYIMTRLENLTMLLIFLSFGITAVLLRPEYLGLRIFDLRDNINAIFVAGILPLLLFLLIGGLYTGEIARIFLFIYPFFLLVLRNVGESTLRFLLVAAGVQTVIMQTIGGYFW
ncbi:MAG: hypothetical protein HY761_04675 [Candidatus Omnitrophica bacterium]|nr:hypothetical protein [Candidatus Omnitrophota bacterium]